MMTLSIHDPVAISEFQASALRLAIGTSTEIPLATIAPWLIVLTVLPEHHAFDGEQIWCASISRSGVTNKAVSPARWSVTQISKAQEILRGILDGCGDPQRSRCITADNAMYLQRQCLPNEIDPLGRMSKITQDAFLPIGPVSICWSVGIPNRLSGMPCDAPVRQILVPNGPFFSTDCGECRPCRARTEVRTHARPCLATNEDPPAWPS